MLGAVDGDVDVNSVLSMNGVEEGRWENVLEICEIRVTGVVVSFA